MNWKEEAVRQWSADPCGAVEGVEFASPAFFRSVDFERYDRYAPWMRAEMGFDQAAGKRVLEVGCGLGTDLTSFARGGAVTFGIDLTERHLRATRKRFLQDERVARLARADAERLPFQSESLDVVYSFGVLHHTPDARQASREIHRILKPGGRAIVGLYHRDSDVYWRSHVLGQGILRGKFLTDGYRKTLSRIEYRGHSEAVPLVRVYSRRGAARLFEGFRQVRVQVRHFSFDQMGRWGQRARRFLGKFEGRLAETIGWYVIVHADK